MMSDMPKEIWTHDFASGIDIVFNGLPNIKYIRADLVPQWQPIETAPKDETVVRVWDGKRQYDAWYGKDYNYENEPAEWLSGDGDGWSTGYYFTPCNPTHWMPLPEPPKED